MPYNNTPDSAIKMYDSKGKQTGLMMKGSVAHMNELNDLRGLNPFAMPDSSDLKFPTTKPTKTVSKKNPKAQPIETGGLSAAGASVSSGKITGDILTDKTAAQGLIKSKKSTSATSSDPMSRKQMKIQKLRMKGERAIAKVKAGQDAGKDVSFDQAQAKHLRERYDRKVARTARQEERKENRAAKRVARKKKAIARKQSKI